MGRCKGVPFFGLPPIPASLGISCECCLREERMSMSAQETAVTLRVATPDDAAAIRTIYAPYVTDTAITFEVEVPSEEEFRSRISQTLARYPYFVALTEAGEVCGYAYAGAFKGRAAYDPSAEVSIYVAPSAQGKGVGRALYEALEKALLKQGVVNVYACIAVTPRPDDAHLTNASTSFHQHLGYELVGTFKRCARKFDQWYDMCWMGKQQGGEEDALRPFKPFPLVSEE